LQYARECLPKEGSSLGLGIYTKLRNNLFIRYNSNSEKYWKNYGKKMFKEYSKPGYLESHKGQEKYLVQYLKDNVDFENVFEFGCGFGRITKLILDNFSVKKYVALDVSEDNIQHAKKACRNHKNVEFMTGSINDVMLDEKFDLVLGVAVLMHVPFKKIDTTIKKLTSLSRKHIINIDWYEVEKISTGSNFYCFVHDYKKLYNDSGVKQVQVTEIPENFLNQKLIHGIKQ